MSAPILFPGHELCTYLSLFWSEGSSNDPGLSLVLDYLEANQSRLRWFVEDVTGRPRKLDVAQARQFCETRIRGHEHDIEDSGHLGAYGGEEKKGVSPWTIRAAFQSPSLGSRVMATWPLDASPSWTDLVQLMERACGPAVLLAHAGLTYSHSVFYRQHPDARHALLPRYWGIDPPEPSTDGFAARAGVRSPSWLTYVSTTKLERLPAGSLEKLPSEILQTKLPHGTLFQLGPEPILGDQNRGEPMPLHRALARALRPIRGAFVHWTNTTSYEYRTWVARFDDPADEEGGG